MLVNVAWNFGVRRLSGDSLILLKSSAGPNQNISICFHPWRREPYGDEKKEIKKEEK